MTPGRYVDFFETYDDYPVINMLQIEDLGFCAKGESAGFRAQPQPDDRRQFPDQHVRRPAFRRTGGRLGRFLGTVEAIRQVTGQALGRSVPDARIGLVSGYGMINYDRGLCSAAAILAAGD